MPTKPKAVAAVKRGPGSDDEFVYESSAGTITVPSLAKAKPPNAWQMMELESIENTRVRNAKESMMMIELAAGSDTALDVIKKLDVEEMGEFITAWGEHSGVSLGESKAS